MINRNISPGILLTDETISKANKKRKVSNSLAAKEMLKNGNHNFQIYKAGDKEHVRELRSKRMIGNTLGSIRKITDEFREKRKIVSPLLQTDYTEYYWIKTEDI